jgi:hypothetical protein
MVRKSAAERRSRGVVMVAPVEVGEGGIELLVGNGLLKQHQIADRKAVGELLVGNGLLKQHETRDRKAVTVTTSPHQVLDGEGVGRAEMARE